MRKVLLLSKDKGWNIAGDSFIVGPKTPKHKMGNAKTDNAIVWFAAIGAKDVPILIPAEG